MFGVLIVTHGRLATELLATAETVMGRQRSEFEALSLDWGEGVEAARERIAACLLRLDRGSGVLILTDMFGDTPSNAAASFVQPGRVELLSGVNLPMVVRLGCADVHQMDLATVAEWLESKGRRSIGRLPPAPPVEPSGDE